MPVLKLPAVLTLTFEGKNITLNPDESGRYKLNDLFSVSGASRSRRPVDWLRRGEVNDLIEKLKGVNLHPLKIVNGRNGGTYAIKEIIYAYAEWISPEFHKAVLETFSAAVEGDGSKAVKIARSVARVDGVASRKSFASGLAKHGADKTFYADMSDTVNIIVLGKSSSTLKEEMGIKQYKSLRDHLPDTTLLVLAAVESLAAARLAMSSDSRKAVAREITYDSANDVCKMLGVQQ